MVFNCFRKILQSIFVVLINSNYINNVFGALISESTNLIQKQIRSILTKMQTVIEFLIILTEMKMGSSRWSYRVSRTDVPHSLISIPGVKKI